MATYSFHMPILPKRGSGTMVRVLTIIRLFFVVAMLVAGVLELSTANALASPVSQIGISTICGLAGVALAKLSHLL